MITSVVTPTRRRHAVAPTSLGDLTLVLDGDALVGIYFPGHWTRPERALTPFTVSAVPTPAQATAPAPSPVRALAPAKGGSGREAETPALPVDPLAVRVREQLVEYLAGERRDFDLPLRLEGSDLHRRVWSLLQQIPYGTTTTYGALAAEVGAPAQAVGQAVGANPVSIVVPCHRVVGSDGSITGYAGGLDRKRTLLALEEPDATARGALF